MKTRNEHSQLFQMARLKNNRNRAAMEYDSFAFLKERVCNELVERVCDVSRQFRLALDWGAHDGRSASKLLDSKKAENAICLELSPLFACKARAHNLLSVSAPFESVPFRPNTFDLVVSALSLHWVNDLPNFLSEINLSMAEDGFFVAAFFGLGTLKELRDSMIEAEIECSGGATTRLPPMPSLQDMATLLQISGFALPVADIQPITVRYSNIFKLLDDIRGMGEQAPTVQRHEHFVSRTLLERTDKIYRENYAESDDKIPATFQIIWISGWSPSPNQPKALKPGSAKHSLAAAVRRSEKQN